MNWLGAPAAPCAQASEMRFIGEVREAKRAALCHSVRPPPGRKESPRPGAQGPGPDGGPQRAHQLEVEVEVMDGVQARAQDLVAAVQVAQVGAAVVAAGITPALRIDPPQVLLMDAVPDVDDPAGGEQVPIAGVAR